MHDTPFFPKGSGLTLTELAEMTSAALGEGVDGSRRVTGISTLGEADASDLSFFDNPRYAGDLAETAAACVLVAPKHLQFVPEGIPRMVVKDPHAAFAAAGRALFPAALSPGPSTAERAISAKADIDPSARLEEGVIVEAFAVIGPKAQIGRGTIVAAGSVIGADCRIGRDCRIGAGVTISHALVGNRVILHPGVRIGQDGFGYAPGAAGLEKVVQIGRVVIQDDVEVGANTTIDRGAMRDTVVGEATKIDNQVQIAHNVRIGRHCVIVSQVGISGSVEIGDQVMIGGQTGVNGHVSIGDRAQIAAVSTVAGDVPAGARWGGTPAKPVREWFREMTLLTELAKKRRAPGKNDE
ncbi:UDP-3-O-(3-hydroxymyristoyl)glucosamine N-acyltransferase [Jiella sp. M17.18]|uniref:UDP-3-O-(3-hydroxymyristoyl)glucosamine N-acyltransferase n=1 Tax=Jiella sp. M17.18 TaxID=3234247 RepID=UPI0034DE6229